MKNIIKCKSINVLNRGFMLCKNILEFKHYKGMKVF